MIVSVIIPFYQRESGILRRALVSVLSQQLWDGVAVHIIIIDDGSPVSVQSEVEGLTVGAPFLVKILLQDNAGVGAARNAGLHAVHMDTRYIAFLDSDDSWQPGHLAQGLRGLESDYDFYFCDNERAGHHDSHFASSSAMILPFIQRVGEHTEILSLSKQEITTLILRNFPCQISTTIYRRQVAKDLMFEPTFKNAGEDMVFFLNLAARCESICFSPRKFVHCGQGINLYFANLAWDSPGSLNRCIDNMKAYIFIRDTCTLLSSDKKWNDETIAAHRRKIVFLALRQWIKTKGNWPQEMKLLARNDSCFPVWFGYYAAQVCIGRMLKIYKPS